MSEYVPASLRRLVRQFPGIVTVILRREFGAGTWLPYFFSIEDEDLLGNDSPSEESFQPEQAGR